MKICCRCNVSQELINFSWKSKKDNKLSSTCKTCQNKISKEHYQNNKSTYLQKATKNTKAIREQNRLYLKDYLSSHPCVDCGYSDIRALQFDHIDMLDDCKSKRVPHFISYSLIRLKEEIAKCEIRCANCHTIRTRQQLGWNHYD